SGPSRVEGELALTTQQNFLGFVDAGSQKGRTAEIGVQALHKAAVGLANFRRGGTRLKTKDLVGLLLSHGARSWRCTQPVAVIRMRVVAPGGKSPVKISFKKL